VSPPSPAASLPAPRDKAIVYVVNPKATGDQDPLMPRTVALHRSSSPARDAVNALLQSEGSPLPPGTALRGITVSNGLATLDFSQSPINETGGEGGQGTALTALSRTLGQFPEIRQYQIEVKGQPMKSFGEEGALDGPMDVVRPDAVQQAKGTAP
jgi:spore germination protein GerM